MQYGPKNVKGVAVPHAREGRTSLPTPRWRYARLHMRAAFAPVLSCGDLVVHYIERMHRIAVAIEPGQAHARL